MIRNPMHLVACGFGSGFVPKIPGTAGTLVGIPIVLLMQLLPVLGQWLAVVLMFLVGCYVCEYSARALNLGDPGAIVWDEITGFCVAMMLVPVSVLNIVIAFILFRVFDIAKPWPISLADRKVSGGFGIMLDDLIAGVFANAALQILLLSKIL